MSRGGWSPAKTTFSVSGLKENILTTFFLERNVLYLFENDGAPKYEAAAFADKVFMALGREDW